MSLLDIAKKRYSVRKYEDKPVEKEKLEKILLVLISPFRKSLKKMDLLTVRFIQLFLQKQSIL